MEGKRGDRRRMDGLTPKLLRLPDDVVRGLEEVASSQDRTFSAQTIRALREWLAAHEAREPRAAA
jgi:predicted transcriptional regulator